MNSFMTTISYMSATAKSFSYGVPPPVTFLRKDGKQGNDSDMGESLGDGGGYTSGA